MLPGLLLVGQGRPRRCAPRRPKAAIRSSMRTSSQFCSQIAPEYKLRGWTDKWLLREVADRVAPQQIRSAAKVMFRANMGSAFLGRIGPTWVDELLSPESLAATGYFDAAAVERVAGNCSAARAATSLRRFAFDMGLAGVISTQLWHHLYCGGGLCELPTWSIDSYASNLASMSSVA